MIHVDTVGHQLRIFFRIELSLFLTGRVSPMIQLGGDVQHVFVSVLEVVSQSAIAVIAFGIDRFRLLVPMILASVLEGECLGTLVPKFFKVLLVGAIVETDFRLSEIQLTIDIVITKPTLGTLRSVVAERTTHIVTTHHIVHHRIGFSIAQAWVFEHFHPDDFGRLQGGDFFLRGFSSVDGELYGASVGSRYTIVYRRNAEARNQEVSQQIHSVGRCLHLLLVGEDQLLVGGGSNITGSYGHFAQLLGIFLQGQSAKVGRTVEALQIYI